MAYSQKAITWAKRQRAAACGCGCGVIIMPKPSWYTRRSKPPEVRYIRGHEPRKEKTHKSTMPAKMARPDYLITASSAPGAVRVQCVRHSCGTQWRVSQSVVANLIVTEGCSFCAIDDIISERTRLGLPIWPDDDLDEAEGAVEMTVRTYNLLKAMCPGTLGDLAGQIQSGTFRGTKLTETEIRDILDQCGLSEEYI